jgi:hypothetical protein
MIGCTSAAKALLETVLQSRFVTPLLFFEQEITMTTEEMIRSKNTRAFFIVLFIDYRVV